MQPRLDGGWTDFFDPPPRLRVYVTSAVTRIYVNVPARRPATSVTNPKPFESANEFPLLTYSGRDLFVVSLSGK